MGFNVHSLKESKYLKKEDCLKPILVTITGSEEVNLAMDGKPADLKWTLTFKETEKPLVVNSTNGQILAAIFGSDESDDWIGKKIVLYNDPNITFQGKLVGGIRVRAPKGQAASEPKPNVNVKTPNLTQPSIEQEYDINPDLDDNIPY